MASGLFFDPHVLLRVATLITSTFSLWYCVDQYMFWNNFIVPPNRQQGNAILPGYWKTILGPSLAGIFSLYGLSAGTALANVRYGALGSPWYKIGACFTLAHFLFVPVVSKLIEAMVENKSEDDNWRYQQEWLRTHTIRSVLVDFPGWLCFLAAVSQTLRIA